MSTRPGFKRSKTLPFKIKNLKRVLRTLTLVPSQENDEELIEMWEAMKHQEKSTLPSILKLEMQPEVRWERRPFLVDYLIQVHNHLSLAPETLYLALNLVDRYMSQVTVKLQYYQLLGLTALWVAAKYTDSAHIPPQKLSDLCSRQYDANNFAQMERHLLKTLGWRIGHPTAEEFLRIIIKRKECARDGAEWIARFLMELTLFHERFIEYGPAIIAEAALYFAKRILNLSQPTRRAADPCLQCAQLMDELCLQSVSRVVHDKYACEARYKASIRVKAWADAGNTLTLSPISSTHSELYAQKHCLPTPPSEGRIMHLDVMPPQRRVLLPEFLDANDENKIPDGMLTP
ncbi:uncharacterized protein VTP21DRAFT_2326 [Calcarisporiella thermophila]|uniref:uncharacterized protein n=1 Tax=Calcarisporiella thermophila TaxID=911321 RepID=UPI00374368D7